MNALNEKARGNIKDFIIIVICGKVRIWQPSHEVGIVHRHDPRCKGTFRPSRVLFNFYNRAGCTEFTVITAIICDSIYLFSQRKRGFWLAYVCWLLRHAAHSTCIFQGRRSTTKSATYVQPYSVFGGTVSGKKQGVLLIQALVFSLSYEHYSTSDFTVLSTPYCWTDPLGVRSRVLLRTTYLNIRWLLGWSAKIPFFSWRARLKLTWFISWSWGQRPLTDECVFDLIENVTILERLKSTVKTLDSIDTKLIKNSLIYSKSDLK